MASPQPIDHNTPMSTLLDVKFTEVHDFKSPLAQIDLLSSSFLATVSDDDLDAYDSEIAQYRKDVNSVLQSNLRVVTSHVAKLIGNIYGSQSKQYKYMMRNFNSDHEIPCFASTSNLKSTQDVTALVNDARKAQKSTSSVVLADRDVSQIDCAIQYLVQNGYEYGKDFNASNVVNIAKSVAIQDLTNNEFTDLIVQGDNCSDICADSNYDAMVNNEMIRLECACGESTRDMVISFVEDKANSGQHKYELEDIANG